MVESFVDGDGSANYGVGYGPPAQRRSAGIIDSLDHIKSLNVNAIWLTPVFDSCAGQAGDDRLDATGYFACDWQRGSQLRQQRPAQDPGGRGPPAGSMSSLDGVFGHVNKVGVSKPSPEGRLPAPSRAAALAARPAGGLQPAREPGLLQEVARYWIEQYGIDGWRLDQAYQLGLDDWRAIRTEVEQASAARKAAGLQ